MISRKSGQTEPKAASSCCVREASLVTNELLFSAGTLKGLKTEKNSNRIMKKFKFTFYNWNYPIRQKILRPGGYLGQS